MTDPRPSDSTPAIPPTPPAAGDRVVPISELFFRDDGPHVLERGTPPVAAAGSPLVDALEGGIAAIGRLDANPLAMPAPLPLLDVVPIDTLLYRGRRALARARELRDEIRAAGRAPDQPSLDELFDLLDLAAAE